MYFRLIKNILFLFIIVGTSNCSDDEPDNPLCSQRAIINESQYLNANTELLDVVEISIVQNCLNIKLGSSGCDGDSWVIELFDAIRAPTKKFLVASAPCGELVWCNFVGLHSKIDVFPLVPVVI